MSPQFFDIHTHLHFEAFKSDSREVVERALKQEVWMIQVGTQKETSKQAITLAESFREGVYATVGLHPIHTDKSFHDAKELGTEGKDFVIDPQNTPQLAAGMNAGMQEGVGKPAGFPVEERSLAKRDDLRTVGSQNEDTSRLAAGGFISRGEIFDYDQYRVLAKHEKVVAIGECGLDYFRLDESTKKKQKDVFESQIALAHEVGKPLMLHIRNAYDDALEILKSTSATKGNVHFFAGSWETAKKFLDLGFTLSFTGVITFTHDYDEVIKNAPLDMIMSETDAPYVAPMPFRGKRNESLYVMETVKQIAKIRQEDFETVRSALVSNAKRVFAPTPIVPS